MKYLEMPIVNLAQDIFAGVANLPGIFADIRLETFSCKNAGDDKKVFHTLSASFEEMAKSPSQFMVSTSPFGPISESSTQKSFFFIISTLNLMFPECDFCNLQPSEFHKEQDLMRVVHNINSMLARVLSDFQTRQQQLWNQFDADMDLKECNVYSFMPNEFDPFDDGSGVGALWSFCYLFHNKKVKRVAVFFCRATPQRKLIQSIDEMCEEDPEFFEENIASFRDQHTTFVMDFDD
eukprot:TRINITY_DN8590_c0_g1_i1.p1 TRINITY_DN8590_c0_g1~~TRINITY_DN8590_c0_g1_i1.p1  ORF type:complete len:260 (+),score=97.78 TRINITY_DN8590_c0_g1_i1:74-781(+)